MLGQFALIDGKARVGFECKVCGAVANDVGVRARLNDEDLEQWILYVVGRAVRNRHAEINLLCEVEKFDLKMYLPPDTEWIGQALKYTHWDEVQFGVGDGV